MNHELLAALGRERRQHLRDEFAKGPIEVPEMRPLVARALRASGDRLFRLGVALDRRVSAGTTVETPTV
jgi:hypothetical protein